MLQFLPVHHPLLQSAVRKLSLQEVQSDTWQNRIDQMLAFAAGETQETTQDPRKLIGLAAPQVGFDGDIIIIDKAGPEEPSGELLLICKPVVLNMAGPLKPWFHGCYSCGPVCVTLQLPSGHVEVGGYDRHAHTLTYRAEGALACHILWHELAHLDGQRVPDMAIEQDVLLEVVYPHEFPENRERRKRGEPWHRQCTARDWYDLANGLSTRLLTP